VDAHGTRELGDAADQLLDLAGRDHHQVRELIDDDHDVRNLARQLRHHFPAAMLRTPSAENIL
jgi:hypothetical protein